MLASTTFSILFWINTSRVKNKQAKLYVRITVNQKRANISLQHRIQIDSWDSIKSQVKGNSINAKFINNYLEQVRLKLFKCYQ